MRPPKDYTEIRLFLSLISRYISFLPNLNQTKDLLNGPLVAVVAPDAYCSCSSVA